MNFKETLEEWEDEILEREPLNKKQKRLLRKVREMTRESGGFELDQPARLDIPVRGIKSPRRRTG
jgi:hypothetical protein